MPWPPPTHMVSRPYCLVVPWCSVVEQRRGDARPGHAERVAHRDRAAVDVELVLARCPALRAERDDLHRERLVDLDEVDVGRWTSRPAPVPAWRTPIGPSPMTSGRERRRHRWRRLRASGVSPSSAGLGTSLMMTTTAAAPSLSGHAVARGDDRPSGRKTGLRLADAVDRQVVPARGPSSVVTWVPSSEWSPGMISREKKPALMASSAQVLASARPKCVHLLAGDAGGLGDVLRGVAHRDVGVGDACRPARGSCQSDAGMGGLDGPVRSAVGPNSGLCGVGPRVGRCPWANRLDTLSTPAEMNTSPLARA